MNTSLEVIIKENEIESTQGQFLLSQFAPFLRDTQTLLKDAEGIQVTDISQTEEMKKARETRLALKDVRVDLEKTRKSLKERALKEGNAIDGLAKIIKGMIEPIELKLENQEKYVINLELEKKAKVEAERALELSKYVEDITLYNYKELSPEAFSALLANVQKAYDAKQLELKAEADKLEAARLEKEKEDERIREENKLLLKEKEEREAKEKKDREDAHVAREKELFEQKKKDDIAAAKLKEETDARLKAEKIIADAKVEEDRKKKEIEEHLRLTKLAPEKDKLAAFAASIKNIQTPVDLSVAGRAIADDAEKKLLAVAQEILLKIKTL